MGIVIDGAWTNFIRYKLYNQYVQTDNNNIEPDMMGFVDKDVEKILGKDIDIYHDDNVSKTSFNNRV